MGKALGRFWDTTFGKDGAYGKAIEIRKQAWEAAGRFLTEAWKKTLRFAQDVGAWYHENIGKMIYRNIAWYDKQVLQPLKREPLTFIGRVIGTALAVLGVALCVIYCASWVVQVAIPWVENVALPAVAKFGNYLWTEGIALYEWGKAMWHGGRWWLFDFSLHEIYTSYSLTATIGNCRSGDYSANRCYGELFNSSFSLIGLPSIPFFGLISDAAGFE